MTQITYKNNHKPQYLCIILTMQFTVNKPSFSQDDFFLGKCFEAMEVDSLSSSHPVSTHVENPTQIQEMFDDVSYDKVSLILSVYHCVLMHLGIGTVQKMIWVFD